jgi:hypothetical protein
MNASAQFTIKNEKEYEIKRILVGWLKILKN